MQKFTMYSSESFRTFEIKQSSVSELSRPWKPEAQMGGY